MDSSFFSLVNEIIEQASHFMSSSVLLIILVGTGVYLTITLKGIQFTGLSHALQMLFKPSDKKSKKQKGELSPFEALTAALSATIGTGNIAGVATAIAAGGPGAIFWMWVTALVGMATKYSSCMLAVKYRTFEKGGVSAGGPMYTIVNGMGKNFQWLAIMFALSAAITALVIGDMVQSNSVAIALKETFQVDPLITGLGMGIFTGLVIIGGIKRIGHVASKLVPSMSILYVGSALLIILFNFSKIPEVFSLIFYHAFNPTAASGGFLGAVVAQTIRYGVARGVFSNESGLGSAAIAHAAVKTNSPVRQGLIAMIGPFVDTIIVCSMTAFVIILSGLWTTGANSSALTSNAFASGLPGIGHYIVTISIALFAFSTTISWWYYGDRCIDFLFKGKGLLAYKWIFVLVIPLGAIAKIDLIWNFADLVNGFMALPNLISLIALSPVILNMTQAYFKSK